jgi:hypothetical protein
MKGLQPHPAKLHACACAHVAISSGIRHDLPCKHFEYTSLDLRLQLAGGAQIARYNGKNVVQYASGLHTDGLRGIRDVHNGEEVSRRGVPCDIWGAVDQSMYVEESNAPELRDPKIARSLTNIIISPHSHGRLERILTSVRGI